MGNDRSTVETATPISGSWCEDSMALRAAFARAGIGEAGPPRPALGDEVGRYTLIDVLGEGGMGVVYKAYDPQLDRNVALKLLHRVIDEDDSGSEYRLLREAQMLAKLQHPNVVAVYDTGSTRYGVFIAMELLHGCTLSEWLGQRRRSVEEILEVFRAAGEGLAAAHDLGFVHRDFKLSNVIVGDDGIVRVLDFGVASLMDPRQGWPCNSTGSSLRQVSRPPGAVEPLSGSDPHLTDDDCVVGTPAFMAPEQVAGNRVNHRSDQFTFCVCLHVALYGYSPLIGEGFGERSWHLAQDRVLDPQRMLVGRPPGRVPARVRHLLRRGLSADPVRRFASMRVLLDELEEPPRRWPLVVAGSMLVLGFGAGVVVESTTKEDPCEAVTNAVDEVWSEADRDAVRFAFIDSEHPRAEALWGRVEQRLDGYAAEWSTMRVESCHATLVTRQQSEALHDQRLRCLGRRRNRMRSTIDALGRIEDPRQATERALLPFLLPRLADCADLEALSAMLPLPGDPELRRSVEALQRSIDEIAISKDSGELSRGLELARGVVQSARQTQHAPVIAEALEHLGILQVLDGSASEGQATLEAAIVEAATAGDDATAARSWPWVLHALSLQRRFDEGKWLELAARAAVERASDDLARGELLDELGGLYGESGELERAWELKRQSIEVEGRALGEDHVAVGIAWFELGSLLIERGRYPRAREAMEHARSIFEVTVGSSHELSDFALLGTCRLEHESGEEESSIELCGRALESFASSPASTEIMGRTHLLMAEALRGAGRLEEARAQALRGLELARHDEPALAEEIERWLWSSEGPTTADEPGRR